MADHLDQTLQAAADGDADAWRKVVELYSSRVYGLLYRQCGDGDLAEEMTQSTFVKILSKLDEYQEQGKFEAWLFRIALNRLRDEMRRRKRQAMTVDFDAAPPESFGHRSDEPGPTRVVEQDEQIARLREMVDQLPEADRQLLHLRYTAELSFARIAETLDQPLGTVLARGHRALKKLRRMLDEEEDGQS